CDCAWAPGIAEVGLVNPIAVLVEVFVTDDIPRDIFGRSGFALATLPLVRPAFERGAWRERLGSHAERLETGEDAAHISAHDMRRPIAEDIGDAVTGLYNSLIGLRVHFDVVFPRLTQRHGDVGRLDLDRFAFRKTSHAESGRALCEAHVDDVVVKLDEAEARALVEIDRCRAYLQLGPCAGFRPQPIAAGERAIEDRLSPLFSAGRGD